MEMPADFLRFPADLLELPAAKKGNGSREGTKCAKQHHGVGRMPVWKHLRARPPRSDHRAAIPAPRAAAPWDVRARQGISDFQLFSVSAFSPKRRAGTFVPALCDCQSKTEQCQLTAVAAVVRIVPLVAIVATAAILPIMPAVMRVVTVGPSINDRRPVIHDGRRAIWPWDIDHRRRRQAHRCSHDHSWGRMPDDNVRQWGQRQAEPEINSARMG